jgi:hypothetical protein
MINLARVSTDIIASNLNFISLMASKYIPQLHKRTRIEFLPPFKVSGAPARPESTSQMGGAIQIRYRFAADDISGYVYV